MRPATSPIRPVSSSSSSSGSAARRRRQDLTLPLPQRDFSTAVPLPLPPLSAPAIPSSSFSFPGAGAGAGAGAGTGTMATTAAATHLPQPPAPSSAPSSTSSSSLNPPPALSDLERVRRIGSGSGGTVWMVRHRTTGRIYALKVIYGNHDDAVRRQILREIEILRTADSPYVVRCHGMYDHGGEIQVLLEYMDGGSLEGKRISSEPVLAAVAAQVLQGLAYLHRRHIVHRDIKPSNLLADSHRRVKIADFGVSRILAQTMDPCNSSVGTIAYMSPERINTDLNQGIYDGYAGDIWSFGLSILEFYLGRFPFGENVGRQGDWASLMCAICYAEPPEAPPTASREFRSFISCCLQKEPAKRQSAVRLLQHPFITQASSAAQVNSMLHLPPPAGPQLQQPPPPPPLSS